MQGEDLLRGLLGVWTVLGLAGRGNSARHAVYWNSTNPRFYRGDYTVVLEINDYLDIYCPHYDTRVPMELTESFTLYMVKREGYEGCYETPQSSKRWECNKPHAPFGPIKFSDKIQRFTPFSLGFEFEPGKDYYYISVPDADSIGECLRLRVTVCCQPTAEKPVTGVPKSEPRGGLPGGRRRRRWQDIWTGRSQDTARKFLILYTCVAILGYALPLSSVLELTHLL